MERLIFKNGKVEDYTIVLSTRDYRHLGQLTGIRGINNINNLNKANEMSFTICKYDLYKYDENNIISRDLYLKIKKELWEEIVDLKLIWVKELDEYFEIKVAITDSGETTKAITATSLCEAELSQIETGTIEINTETDIERDDYEITTFCNFNNHKASLLHRVLDKAPHYTIRYVDESLMNIQRSFSIDTNIYDFLIGECSEQVNCMFIFDSAKREISVYDLYTVCQDCGERGEFYDECPNCESTNLKYFGDDTTILVDKNNLSDNIQLSTNVDSIKNCFKLVAGDGLMTATIRRLNPSGSDYIYYFSENQKKDMPKELVKKLDEYDLLVSSYNKENKQLVNDIYKLTNDILYLESGMMPSVSTVSDISDIKEPKQGIIYLCGKSVYIYDGTQLVPQDENAEFYTNLIPSSDVITATSEAKKLTIDNLSPLGLSSVSSSTSIATVNSALKNYAKVYVKTGYVKIDIDENSTFAYVGTDENGFNYGIWNGRFIVTNYSDEEDITTTDYMSIKIYDNYEEFIRQKILKTLVQEENEEGSIFDVLAIEDLDKFENALKLYGKNRLKSFYDAIQSALEVLMQLNEASENSELYNVLYLPYYNKLQACQDALDERQKSIDSLQEKLDDLENSQLKIQEKLNLETYLGEHYLAFCAYRREQKYSNENFISDGLSDDEIIKNAEEFIENAKKELVKSSELQYTISSTLYNLLVLPEFKPIVDNFKLGNWIRLKVDGQLYRLRLIGYSINFDNLQTINVEFSTISKIKDVAYEAQQIINSAQSMASTYGYVSKQAEKGNAAQNNIESWTKDGLNSGLIQIQNNNNQEVIYGKHGILCRSFDDISGTYDKEQVKITHNIIAFTDSYWKSVRQVIGKHRYKVYNTETGLWDNSEGYGVTTDFVTANGQIAGAIMVGGKIYSENYCDRDDEKQGLSKQGTFIDLNEGTFSFAGGDLTYSKDNGLKINSDAIDGKISSDQIESIVPGQIKGDIIIPATNINTSIDKIKNSQIESINSEQIDGKISSDQIESIDISQVTGTIKADSVDAENINGAIDSSQISNTLSNKTMSNVTLFEVTTLDNNGSIHNGMTANITIGTTTLIFVNGLLVDYKQ